MGTCVYISLFFLLFFSLIVYEPRSPSACPPTQCIMASVLSFLLCLALAKEAGFLLFAPFSVSFYLLVIPDFMSA